MKRVAESFIYNQENLFCVMLLGTDLRCRVLS